MVLVTPFAVYFLVTGVGAPFFNKQLSGGLAKLTTSSMESTPAATSEALDDQSAHLLGLAFAGTAMMGVAKAAWGRRQTTESWRLGAEGERRTGALLAGLARKGYVPLHDRLLPGGRENIDHIVVGPTGVCVVETKNYTGAVVIGRGRAKHNGRPMDRTVQQAMRQVAAVERALGPEWARGRRSGVRAIVCVHGAEVRMQSWWTTPTVGGVRFCSSRQLRRVLTRGQRHLEPAAVHVLVARLEAALAPAVPTPPIASASTTTTSCTCGAVMVQRQRRADGAPFWGCSRYPACRETRAAFPPP